MPAGRADRRGARAGRRGGHRHRSRRLRLRPGPATTPPTCSTPATGWMGPPSSGCSVRCPVRAATRDRPHRQVASVKVVVTGGAGFIGANLCRAPAPIPTWDEVVALDDLSTGLRANLDDLDGVGARRGIDPRRRPARPGRSTAPTRSSTWPPGRRCPDRWPTRWPATWPTPPAPWRSWRRPAATARPHVVVASSSSVYGANPVLPKREDMATMPVSPYAASKLAAESATLAYGRSFDLPVLAFRFFNVFGPLQAADHAYAAVVPTFVAAALRGEPLPVHGDGAPDPGLHLRGQRGLGAGRSRHPEGHRPRAGQPGLRHQGLAARAHRRPREGPRHRPRPPPPRAPERGRARLAGRPDPDPGRCSPTSSRSASKRVFGPRWNGFGRSADPRAPGRPGRTVPRRRAPARGAPEADAPASSWSVSVDRGRRLVRLHPGANAFDRRGFAAIAKSPDSTVLHRITDLGLARGPGGRHASGRRSSSSATTGGGPWPVWPARSLTAVLVEYVFKPLVGRRYRGVLSYPSGNVADLAAVATAWAWPCPAGSGRWSSPRWGRRRPAMVVAVIGLRWHYPTDALAGAVLGVGVVLLGGRACSTSGCRGIERRPLTDTRSDRRPARSPTVPLHDAMITWRFVHLSLRLGVAFRAGQSGGVRFVGAVGPWGVAGNDVRIDGRRADGPERAEGGPARWPKSTSGQRWRPPTCPPMDPILPPGPHAASARPCGPTTGCAPTRSPGSPSNSDPTADAVTPGSWAQRLARAVGQGLLDECAVATRRFQPADPVKRSASRAATNGHRGRRRLRSTIPSTTVVTVERIFDDAVGDLPMARLRHLGLATNGTARRCRTTDGPAAPAAGRRPLFPRRDGRSRHPARRLGPAGTGRRSHGHRARHRSRPGDGERSGSGRHGRRPSGRTHRLRSRGHRPQLRRGADRRDRWAPARPRRAGGRRRVGQRAGRLGGEHLVDPGQADRGLPLEGHRRHGRQRRSQRGRPDRMPRAWGDCRLRTRRHARRPARPAPTRSGPARRRPKGRTSATCPQVPKGCSS